MEIISLEGTEDTPKILLNKENGILEISGRSLPEDSAEYYQPILDWIEEYATSPNEKTEFVFKLEYFNTASSKLILDVLSSLEDIPGMSIMWYFHEDDEDMQEAGEEFSELVELPFEFKTY
jgi:SiaC family regulatory phosphoprotein